MVPLDTARQRAAQTKRERSRAAILQASAQLFREQGWRPATMTEIANLAGVGVATVYKHFPNKNLLAGLVFLPIVQDLLDSERWSDASVLPADALSEYVTLLIARSRRNYELTVALLEAVADWTARHGDNITPQDPRYWLPFPAVMRAIIKRGQDAGNFLPSPPAIESAPLLINLLMLRVATRPAESAAASTRLVLTIINRTLGLADPA